MISLLFSDGAAKLKTEIDALKQELQGTVWKSYLTVHLLAVQMFYFWWINICQCYQSIHKVVSLCLNIFILFTEITLVHTVFLHIKYNYWIHFSELHYEKRISEGLWDKIIKKEIEFLEKFTKKYILPLSLHIVFVCMDRCIWVIFTFSICYGWGVKL